MVQQWVFVDVVKTLGSKKYEILKFSRNILHLKGLYRKVAFTWQEQ
jgi:hypothetical protein